LPSDYTEAVREKERVVFCALYFAPLLEDAVVDNDDDDDGGGRTIDLLLAAGISLSCLRIVVFILAAQGTFNRRGGGKKESKPGDTSFATACIVRRAGLRSASTRLLSARSCSYAFVFIDRLGGRKW